MGGDELLVADGPPAEQIAGTGVVDLDQQLQLRQPVDDTADAVGQRGMEEQRLGVGVVEQVPELLVEVAVVDVDRHAAHLECAVLGLEVLVAVVEVERDLGLRVEAGGAERGRDPRRPRVVLGPRAWSRRRS